MNSANSALTEPVVSGRACKRSSPHNRTAADYNVQAHREDGAELAGPAGELTAATNPEREHHVSQSQGRDGVGYLGNVSISGCTHLAVGEGEAGK